MLNQIFDVLFHSAKEVMGEINSIGIKFGQNISQPDHMLIIFPSIIYGFQSWNGKQKKEWCYQRKSQTLLINQNVATSTDFKLFTLFIQQVLEAVDSQKVAFSKNITLEQIKRFR